MKSYDAGICGEAAVARYLRSQKYELLGSRWRSRFGELDLIARSRNGVICFVEVKLRGENSIALPREFVDARKQEKLRKTASMWLSVHGTDAPARFDVAEVYYGKNGTLRVEYLENAFQ